MKNNKIVIIYTNCPHCKEKTKAKLMEEKTGLVICLKCNSQIFIDQYDLIDQLKEFKNIPRDASSSNSSKEDE